MSHMSSNDDQPVTGTKRKSKVFDVHLKPSGTAANVFRVQCHDFTEVGRYLQFNDENGDPNAVFPAADLIATVRVPVSELGTMPGGAAK